MSHPGSPPASASPETGSDIDVRERGAERDGVPQEMDRRLFMQLLVFRLPAQRLPSHGLRAVGEAIRRSGVSAVLYEDVNDPHGLGVLTWSEDPVHFAKRVRAALGDPELGLAIQPGFTMLGRSYSTGYEQDLEYWLIRRPVETVMNEAWNWAVWYPLRRSGAFARLDGREQGAILREHGTIGRAYGAADLAHDVRLACHGLDTNDNEFVIGLIGKDLHPLSHVVQSMRKTRQTAEYISQMGPFFVGHAALRIAPA